MSTIDDHLTRGEYIRLCSLDRAFQLIGMTATIKPTPQKVFSTAEEIAEWLKKGDLQQ